jgi:hypothetical protein
MAELAEFRLPEGLGSMDSPSVENDGLLRSDDVTGVTRTEPAGSIQVNPNLAQRDHRNRLTPVLAIATAVVVVIWNGFLTFRNYGVTSESVGFWIGSLLPPFLIAYLAGGVKKWRNPAAFCVCLLVIGVLLPAATHQKTLSSLPKKQMLREMAGTDPLDPNLTVNDASAANAIRQVFAEIRQFRQAYNTKYAALKPSLNAVCTTRSFASRQDMMRTRDAVSTRLELDRSVSDFLQKFPKFVANKFDQANLPITQRKQYEDGFNASFANSEFLSARSDMMQSEDSWASATLDLYNFALQHQQQISVGGGKVRIAGDALFLEFNRKLQASESLHRDFAAKNARVIAIQQASFKKMGVTSRDLGIAQ